MQKLNVSLEIGLWLCALSVLAFTLLSFHLTLAEQKETVHKVQDSMMQINQTIEKLLWETKKKGNAHEIRV